MTNLDYEHRMNALNQLIHETLGVSLNTVRAAYGRARTTHISVKSTASETGRLPVSSARPPSLADLSAAFDAPGMPDGSHPMLETIPESSRPSFLVRFRRAQSDNAYSPRRDALPMAIFSKQPAGYGDSASDWHRLRNQFWTVAQTDKAIMDRYMRDVLG